MNVAFIPVRGGSKSIPMKNIKLIAGKPLVYWVAKAACDCLEIDAVYVSSDSEAICDTVASFGFDKLEIIGRSSESVTDTASTEISMLEFASRHMFDNIALIQATSPLLTASDLTKGFAALLGADSVLSVVNQKRFTWRKETTGFAVPSNYDYLHRPLRQDFEGYLVENGAFYITRRDALLSSKCRISGKIRTVEMPLESYIEIDEPEDWVIVEALLKRQAVVSNNVCIKMFLTDCDGTLTDGGMYYGPDGEMLKKFNTRDGAGLRMLKERGIITGIITGEISDIVRKRAKKIGVDEVLTGIDDKRNAINKLCVKYNISLSETAYIGDDINDLDALKIVGFSFCPANSISEVKIATNYTTKSYGGAGAVREAAEFVLSRLCENGTYKRKTMHGDGC